MSADEACRWCGRTEPSMDESCPCHRADCPCQPCSNARYWAYLEAGPALWHYDEPMLKAHPRRTPPGKP